MSERLGESVVVGAGVAGIAAARALADLGYRVRLLERERALRAEGAGLTLWPNAVRVLRQLGFGDALDSCAHPIRAAATLRPVGDVIARAPLAKIAARYGPLLSVHRGELMEGLHAACCVPVEFGAEVSRGGGSLLLRSKPIGAGLVVGADGIGSAVRDHIAPGVLPRAAGYSAWRGVASTGGSTPGQASETLGPGRRFGLVPLSQERTYWFAVIADGEDQDLESAFAGWHAPIQAVLAATPPEQRTFLDLRDLPPLPRWQRHSAVLVGDAAHAMTPNLGQGAAQALLDVEVLRQELAARPLSEALLAYERTRKATAERIVIRSRLVGRVAQVSHPVAVWARNTAARVVPQAVMAREMGKVVR